MLIQIYSKKFETKPSSKDMGLIKSGLTKPETIQDLTVEEIAKAFTQGQVIQPGVCPFSEESRKKGKKGTCADDFKEQTLFCHDIDNDKDGIELETPDHAFKVLADHNLTPAFMYETPSSKSPEKNGRIRFRLVLVSDKTFTVKAERDRVMIALEKLFPQSDQGVHNADRVFAGTDKGLIEGYTDFNATCKKEDLLALADFFKIPEDPDKKPTIAKDKQNERQRLETKKPSQVVRGDRVNTLISLVGSMITKGIPRESIKAAVKAANNDFMPPLEESELENEVFPAIDRWRAEGEERQLIPEDFSDTGQAMAFLKFGDIAETTRYNKSLGGFLKYNGTVWLENANIELEGMYQRFTDVQLKMARDKQKQALKESFSAQDRGDKDTEQQTIKKWKATAGNVIRYRNSARIDGTLKALRSSCLVDISKFDCDPYLLNTPGGVVDLRTGELRAHKPEDYFTKVTKAAPSDNNMDMWLDQIKKVCCDDDELAHYLKLIHGMMILGAVYQEKLIIIYGGGGNGKSSVFDADIKVLGDYAGGLSADTLMHTRKNVMPEYAELRGKRFVLARELDDGQRLNSAAVKRLCSTDPIHAEPKYKQPFDFTPSHTIVLYTNHLPKVDSSDAGTWDRLVVVPFNARFRDKPGEIKNYGEVLADKAGGAILKWMIEGAVEFINNDYKLPTPEAVKNAVEAYKKDNDWLSIFLDERTEIQEGNRLSSQDLYACYNAWARSQGEYIRGSNDFKAAMEKAGYTYRRNKSGMKVLDIALADAFY